MNPQDYLLEALEMVTIWDMPEESFSDTVTDQANLMLGGRPEDHRPFS